MKNGICLKIENLSRFYGDLKAVDRLNLEVYQGEIFGFLGPNGAGKTTSINMISGSLKPDQGDIVIHGLSITQHLRKIRKSIGLCPQELVIWEQLTCMEQLIFMGRMFDLKSAETARIADKLLDELGLAEKKNRLAKTLSGGMKRRLNLALGLVHNPELVILDEPEAGLDPQSHVLVREHIRNLSKKQGKTVILTTHNMDEAERLSDRVAVIDKGRLLDVGTSENLKLKYGQEDVVEIGVVPADHEKVLRLVRGILPEAVLHGDVISSGVKNTADLFPRLLEIIRSSGCKTDEMKVRRTTLEDVFLSLTGRGLRE